MEYSIKDKNGYINIYISYNKTHECLKTSQINLSYEDKNKTKLLKLLLKFLEDYNDLL